jgi:hypothetical protein
MQKTEVLRSKSAEDVTKEKLDVFSPEFRQNPRQIAVRVY